MNILGSMLATREERVEDRKVGQCTRVPTCEPADRCLEYRGTGIVHDPPHRGDPHSQLFRIIYFV